MDVELTRTYVLRLPHVVETMQWGANLVFWVGDKAIGGKMFLLLDLDDHKVPSRPTPVAMFYAGPERYSILLEQEGVVPAPYMARAYWIAIRDWSVYRSKDLEALLLAAHDGVYARLPKRTKDILALPARQQSALIKERKQLLAATKVER